MVMKKVIILAAALAACGGAQKTGSGGGGNVPPPPELKQTAKQPANPKTAETQQAKVEVSKDAKADYQAAFESFMTNEKGGWNESACRASADKFEAVARAHSELVQAQVMVGLSFERCGLSDDARKAYEQASHMKGND